MKNMGKKKIKSKQKVTQILKRRDILLCPYFRVTEYRDKKTKGFWADCFCLYEDYESVPYPFAIKKFKSDKPNKNEISDLKVKVVDSCSQECPKLYESFWYESTKPTNTESKFDNFFDQYPMNDTLLCLPPGKGN